jgi:predicted GNAT family N-acyltransferase
MSCERITTWDQLIDALRIRVAVFIQEQGFPPGWEPDEVDKSAEHYVAIIDGVVVATTRLHVVEPASRKIERMAVLKEYRGQHIGTLLTQHIIAQAQQADIDRLWLDAQSHAESFYQQLGFKTVSGCYYPWGLDVPHVTMEYHGLCKAG